MHASYTESVLAILCDFSALTKDHFKCLMLFSGLQEVCQTHIYCRILRMLEAQYKIALEDLVNKGINLDIKYKIGMNEKKYGERSYVNGVSSKICSRMFRSFARL